MIMFVRQILVDVAAVASVILSMQTPNISAPNKKPLINLLKV